jgi:hypothetical protein
MPRRTFVDPRFPARLRELREARGFGIRRLAREVPCTHPHVINMEAGKADPSPEMAARLDVVLGANGALSALVVEASASTVEQSPAGRPTGVTDGAQNYGGAAAFADQVRRAVEDQLDDGLPYADRMDRLQQQASVYAAEVAIVAPMEMIERLTPSLTDAQQMLRYARTSTDTQHLRTVLAQLSAIVADEYNVLGDVDSSHAWHATAAAAADRAGSPQLQATVRTLAAMLPLYHGRQSDVIRVAQQALQFAGDAPCFAVSLASMFEALARARLGDHDGARLALRRSQNAHDDMDGSARVESIFGFSERRRLFYEGRLLTMVADYPAAADAHQQARRLYSPRVVGDPAIMSLDQANALIGTKDYETGAELIVETLSGLPADHQTGVFLAVAARAFGAVPAAALRLPAARACAELLDEMTNAG